MSYTISTVSVDDLDSIAKLIDDYVRQNLNMSSWPGSPDVLKRDYACGCFNMNAIGNGEKMVGFVAWMRGYDLHHCVHGAFVTDLYIDSAYRCRGLAAMLICAIAAEITRQGWSFMRGQALSGRATRLYERVGVRFGTNEYNVSGKALRQLASLAGRSTREIVRGLPTRDMNWE